MSNREAFEKAFYSDGYKLGMQAVEAGLTPKSLFAALEKMHAVIDGMIESLTEFARQNNQPIDCKKGCDWCCHQPIFALEYELDYLHDYLENNFSESELASINKRAGNKNKKLAELENEKLLHAKHPCPLLKKGACIAYEARPVACRIYLSTNVETCMKFFKTPDDKTSFPALLDFPMRAGRMMNEGFKAALKMGEFDAKEFRIEEKLI